MFGPKIFRVSTLPQTELDDLKQRNWAQWCHEAQKAKSYCSVCQWPMDELPVNPNNPDNRYVPDRCLVCIALSSVISASPYFRRLEREEEVNKRRMGLSGSGF